MNRLLGAIEFVLFWCFILALFFVFSGEPDLWDVWKERAMEAARGKG